MIKVKTASVLTSFQQCLLKYVYASHASIGRLFDAKPLVAPWPEVCAVTLERLLSKLYESFTLILFAFLMLSLGLLRSSEIILCMSME